jgi:hypothetical protein
MPISLLRTEVADAYRVGQDRGEASGGRPGLTIKSNVGAVYEKFGILGPKAVIVPSLRS